MLFTSLQHSGIFPVLFDSSEITWDVSWAHLQVPLGLWDADGWAFPIFLPILDFQSLFAEVVLLFMMKIIFLDEDIELNPDVEEFNFIYAVSEIPMFHTFLKALFPPLF